MKTKWQRQRKNCNFTRPKANLNSEMCSWKYNGKKVTRNSLSVHFGTRRLVIVSKIWRCYKTNGSLINRCPCRCSTGRKRRDFDSNIAVRSSFRRRKDSRYDTKVKSSDISEVLLCAQDKSGWEPLHS